LHLHLRQRNVPLAVRVVTHAQGHHSGRVPNA
jgi:hypothetical protein